jgi:hypothetical protein
MVRAGNLIKVFLDGGDDPRGEREVLIRNFFFVFFSGCCC